MVYTLLCHTEALYTMALATQKQGTLWSIRYVTVSHRSMVNYNLYFTMSHRSRVRYGLYVTVLHRSMVNYGLYVLCQIDTGMHFRCRAITTTNAEQLQATNAEKL